MLMPTWFKVFQAGPGVGLLNEEDLFVSQALIKAASKRSLSLVALLCLSLSCFRSPISN